MGAYKGMPRGYAMDPFDRIMLNSRTEDRGYETPCRAWLKYLNVEGYGVIGLKRNGRKGTMLVHRYIWEHRHGPITDRRVIDHLCRQRDCCEITHLDLVTDRENVLRSPIANAAVNARKTHCPRGHEYTPKNTRLANNGRRRFCRACQAERDLNRRLALAGGNA